MSHFVSFSLTAVGYLCYLPNVHHLVAENPHMPFQEELLRLNPQCLSLLVLFTFIAAMMVKVSGKEIHEISWRDIIQARIQHKSVVRHFTSFCITNLTVISQLLRADVLKPQYYLLPCFQSYDFVKERHLQSISTIYVMKIFSWFQFLSSQCLVVSI